MSGQQQQQRVGWFELFYDLVVVAALAQTGKVFAAEPTWGTTAWIGISLLTLFAIWLLTSLSRGYESAEHPLFWGLVLLQMLAIIVAALSMERDDGGVDRLGFVAVAVAFGTISAVYAQLSRRNPGTGHPAPVIAWSTGLAALILLVGAVLPVTPSTWAIDPVPWFFGAALAVGTIPFFTVGIARAVRGGFVPEEHLTERFGLLIIVVLGESLVSLIIKLSSASEIANPTFLVLTLLVVFSIWVIYFHSVSPFGVPATTGRLRGWIATHWFLVWSSIAASTAFAQVAATPLANGVPADARYWTAAPLVGVVFCLTVLSALAPDRPRGVMTVHLTVLALLIGLTVLGSTLWGATAYVTLELGAVVVVLDAVAFAVLARRAGALTTSP